MIKATYRAPLRTRLNFQPDVQYAVNRGAGIPTPQNAVPLKTDLIIGARLAMNSEDTTGHSPSAQPIRHSHR